MISNLTESNCLKVWELTTDTWKESLAAIMVAAKSEWDVDSSDLNLDFKLYLVIKIPGGGKCYGCCFLVKVRTAFGYIIFLVQDYVILRNKIMLEFISNIKDVTRSWRINEGPCDTKIEYFRRNICTTKKRKHFDWFWNKYTTRRVERNAYIRSCAFWILDVEKL